MSGTQIAFGVLLPASFGCPITTDPASRKLLAIGNRSFLQLLLRSEMSIKGAVGKSGGLHDFTDRNVFESPFPEQAGSLLHDPFIFRCGFFGGVAHFSESSIYDDHHITCMTVIL